MGGGEVHVYVGADVGHMTAWVTPRIWPPYRSFPEPTRLSQPVSPQGAISASPAPGLQVDATMVGIFMWVLEMKHRSAGLHDKHLTG